MCTIVEHLSHLRIVQESFESVLKHATSLGRKSNAEQLTTTRSPTQKTKWRLGTGQEVAAFRKPCCRAVLLSLLSLRPIEAQRNLSLHGVPKAPGDCSGG